RPVGGTRLDHVSDALWEYLWAQEDGVRFETTRPLLAHYTSTPVLEAIFANREIWLSHPRLMNDTEELTWGITAGRDIISGSQRLLALCGPPEVHENLLRMYLRFEHESV